MAALATGCHASTIDARADANLTEARVATEHQIAFATCADHSRIGPNCGLIMRIAASDDFRERFRAKVCARKTNEDCDLAYRRLIDAELAQRYFAADWGEVARACDLHPGRCDDAVAYEELLMNSHNTHLQAKYSEDEERIEAARRAAHRADEEAAVGAVLGAAMVIGGAQVCHSYPSAFGGEATVCSK